MSGPFVQVLTLPGFGVELDINLGPYVVTPLSRTNQNLGIVGATVTDALNTVTLVRGSPAEVLQKILAVGDSEVANGITYVPAMLSSGLGVIALVGTWRATKANNRVRVTGQFTFAPAVAATPETLSISLPGAATSMEPAAVFAAAGTAGGIMSTAEAVTATDVCGQPVARAGTRLMEMAIDQTAAGATLYSVVLSYSL